MIFALRKNPATLTGFEPANLGSSSEYDNHGTTGVDWDKLLKILLPVPYNKCSVVFVYMY